MRFVEINGCFLSKTEKAASGYFSICGNYTLKYEKEEASCVLCFEFVLL